MGNAAEQSNFKGETKMCEEIKVKMNRTESWHIYGIKEVYMVQPGSSSNLQ